MVHVENYQRNRENRLTTKDPLRTATERTSILFVDDEPLKLVDTTSYLVSKGNFANVNIFSASGDNTGQDPLAGGYQHLLKQLTTQLANGNTVIVPLDYSFQGAYPPFEDAKVNGLVWLQHLSIDFKDQIKTGQLAIYSNSTAGQNVLNLYLELGASGTLSKSCPPEELLGTLESISWKSRVTQLLNENNFDVLGLLSSNTIRTLIPGEDSGQVALRHSVLGSLGFLSTLVQSEKKFKFDAQSKKTFADISGILLSIMRSKTLSPAELSASLSTKLENFIWLDLDPNMRNPSFLPEENTPESTLLKVEIGNPQLKLWLFNIIKTIESNAFEAGASVLFPFMHINDNEVVIAFANNGQYIEREVATKLGQEGTSTKGAGRGIGLASCTANARTLGIELIMAQKEFGYKYFIHNLGSQENSEISIDQLQQQDLIHRAVITNDAEIFSYCQQRIGTYRSLPVIVFMAKIPLSLFSK